MANDITDPNINRDEHIEEAVAAKRVVQYAQGTGGLVRAPLPLITGAWDYVGFTNPDANSNYQTWSFKSGGSGGTLVNTIAATYDGNSNITSLTRS